MTNHSHRRVARRLGMIFGVTATSMLLLITTLIAFNPAAASSHREAPLISQDPLVDNTDTYVFISPDDPDTVTLISNWIPFEAPEGGPNYFRFDDDAIYSIHIDNDGDATADIIYQFTFKTETTGADTFLYNTGAITALDDPDWNVRQRYTVTEKVAGVGDTVLLGNARTPPVNIGSKSTPHYEALAAAATYSVMDSGDELKIFAGPRDDPFFVDLQVFDLLTLRGQSAPVGYSSGNNIPVDSVSGFNVHSAAIQVPIDRLVDADVVIGVWATAERPSMTVRVPGGQTSSGTPVQVSRLGMPLVNEVVIPMPLKDIFNALRPADDVVVYTSVPQLQTSVEDPEVGRLLCGLYGIPLPGDGDDDCATEVTGGVVRSGRGDIFDIFLQGMVLADEFAIQTPGGTLTLTAGTNVNRPLR